MSWHHALEANARFALGLIINAPGTRLDGSCAAPEITRMPRYRKAISIILHVLGHSLFFPASAGHKSGAPETGLGLAIAKEINERRRSQIGVVSEGVAGKGAPFGVWLSANR